MIRHNTSKFTIESRTARYCIRQVEEKKEEEEEEEEEEDNEEEEEDDDDKEEDWKMLL
jgi:hypothetical protein